MGKLLIAVLLGSFGAMACANIGTRDVRSSTREVSSWLVRVPKENDFNVTYEQQGDRVIVRATNICEERRQATVEHRTETETFNQSEANDTWLVIGGGGLLALGGATLVDAGSVYSDSKTSRTYNPIGSDNVKLMGISELILGATLATVAVVDIVRASGSGVRSERTTTDPSVTRAVVPCVNPKPVAGVAISAIARGEPLALGSTDVEGQLQVQLSELVPKSWVTGRGPAHMAELFARQRLVGHVGLDPVMVEYAGASWTTAAPGKCVAAEALDACDGVESYLADYPAGSHVEEARTALHSAAEGLAKLKVEQERMAERQRVRLELLQQQWDERQRRETEQEQRKQRASEQAAEELAGRAAKDQAQRAAARTACVNRCQASCGGEASCVRPCVAASCK